MNNITDEKLKGIKLAIVGFITAIGGTIFFVFNYLVVGRIIIVAGILITFLGVVFHFVLLMESRKEDKDSDPFKKKWVDK